MPNDNDLKIKLAQYALLDALHHKAPATGLKSTTILFLRSLYHSVLFKAVFIVAACVLLIVLPFIEHKNSFTASTNYLTLKEDSASTQSKLFWAGMITELLFLGVLTVDVVLRGFIIREIICNSSSTVDTGRKSELNETTVDTRAKNEMDETTADTGQKNELDETGTGLKNETDWTTVDTGPNNEQDETSIKSYMFTFCVYATSLAISWFFFFGGFLTLIEPISFLKDEFTFIRQLVRPVFLIVQVSMIRKSLKAIFDTSLQLISIVLLLFIVIFVFMMLGFAIFPHQLHSEHFGQNNIVADTDTVEEGETYFNSSADTFWYLLVYLSTANSPDFGTPAYNNHRTYFTFFGIFFFMSSYLILKVISAFYALRFYDFLKVAVDGTKKHRKKCIEKAFKALENGSFVKVQTIRNITVSDLNLIDEGSFRLLCVRPEILNEDEFKSLLSKILSCHIPLQENKRNLYAMGSNIDGKCIYYPTYACVKFVTHLVSLPFAMIQFMCLTILLMIDYDNSLTDPHSTMVKAMLAFSCLLFPEFITRFFLLIGHFVWPSSSFKDFDVKRLCRIVLKWFFFGHNLRPGAATKEFFGFLVDFFDWLLLLSIIILGFIHVPCLNKGTYDDCFGLRNLIRLIQVTIVLVIFRMFHMLAKIQTFGIVFKSLLHILILVIPLKLLGYLFYYEFAVIGMAIFRGVNLNDTTAARDCGSYENLNYHPYNFEDFGSSLIVLWNLMIVNNWHIIVDAYVRRMSPYVRIYFVIWWLFTEAILNGVLFGFMMEILSQATESYFYFMKKVKKTKLFSRKFYLIFKYYIWWGKMNADKMSWNIYDFIEDKEEKKLEEEMNDSQC